MNGNLVTRAACVAAAVGLTVACNPHASTVSDRSTLAIKATCDAGGIARYDEVEGKYPGERASADPMDGRFLSDIGELPLPCIDGGADTYRLYQSDDSGEVVVGISQSSKGGRLWVVSLPRQAKIRRAERALLKAEWDSINARITAISFWTQPSRLLEPNREAWRGGWTLEGHSGGRYHRISRFYLDETLRPTIDAFFGLANPLFATRAK